MVILHATTTTKVKIDHTKRPLLTHTPEPLQKHHQFLGGGEGVVHSPLPSHKRKHVELKELLLLEPCKMYQGTKKKNKTNMIQWTSLRLTPIKFGI